MPFPEGSFHMVDPVATESESETKTKVKGMAAKSDISV